MVSTRSTYRRHDIPHQALTRHRRARRWIKRYNVRDTAHRHRLKDRQPKRQRVVSYTRRT